MSLFGHFICMAKWNHTLRIHFKSKRQEVELRNLAEENIYLTIKQLLVMITSLLFPSGVAYITSGLHCKNM